MQNIRRRSEGIIEVKNVDKPTIISTGCWQNYEFWAARMQNTLKNREPWEVVKDGVLDPPSKSTETPGGDYARGKLKSTQRQRYISSTNYSICSEMFS